MFKVSGKVYGLWECESLMPSNGLAAGVLLLPSRGFAVDEVHEEGAPVDLAIPREGHHSRLLVDRPDALGADAVAVEGQTEVAIIYPGMLARHGALRDIGPTVILPIVLFFGVLSNQKLELGPLPLDPVCDVLADILRISVHSCVCLAGEGDLIYF